MLKKRQKIHIFLRNEISNPENPSNRKKIFSIGLDFAEQLTKTLSFYIIPPSNFQFFCLFSNKKIRKNKLLVFKQMNTLSNKKNCKK